MAKEVTEPTEKSAPRITLPGTEREVSLKGARAAMAKLTEDASSLAQDESSGAKSKRIEIAGKLRAIQAAIDATEERCIVHIPADATKQFPFRIGEQEFGPGDHEVRASVAQVLRYMMDQHRHVEHHIHVAGGNFDPTLPGYSGYGKELPSL